MCVPAPQLSGHSHCVRLWCGVNVVMDGGWPGAAPPDGPKGAAGGKVGIVTGRGGVLLLLLL